MTALTTIKKSTMVGATAIVTIKTDDPFCLHPYETFALSAGGPVSDIEAFVSEAAALQAHGRLIEQIQNLSVCRTKRRPPEQTGER